jgi:hypothetical protein
MTGPTCLGPALFHDQSSYARRIAADVRPLRADVLRHPGAEGD